MTTLAEAREQARRLIDADPEARARVERAAIRRRPTRYPATTQAQQDHDFNAAEAALEAEQERRR